jgi:predicted HAD superfamily Cof-like phosphohydrolase
MESFTDPKSGDSLNVRQVSDNLNEQKETHSFLPLSQDESEAEMVKEFVFGKCVDAEDLTELPNPEPSEPIPMTEEQIINLSSFVISEMLELINTVEADPDRANGIALKCLTNAIRDTKYRPLPKTKRNLLAAQADAIVDSSYFGYFFGAKHGLRLKETFKKVHGANMNKRFKATNAFHKRKGDRKIIKPDDWKEPKIEKIFEDVVEPKKLQP